MAATQMSTPSCFARQKEISRLPRSTDTSAAYWDQLAPQYESLYQSAWSRFEDSELRIQLQRIVASANGPRLLDIGCGTGLAYELLGVKNSAIEYVGVDISVGMLGEFRRKHPEVDVVETAGDSLLPSLKHRQFDIVIATNVAASFPSNTDNMLRQISSVLCVGGIVSLSFLNRYSLRRRLRGERDLIEQYRTRGHREQTYVNARCYSASELVSALNQQEFENVKCRFSSVLGGVWESRASVEVERVASRIVPFLGHAVTVSGRKATEGVI